MSTGVVTRLLAWLAHPAGRAGDHPADIQSACAVPGGRFAPGCAASTCTPTRTLSRPCGPRPCRFLGAPTSRRAPSLRR